MLKDATNSQKYELLKEFFVDIFQMMRRDLKQSLQNNEPLFGVRCSPKSSEEELVVKLQPLLQAGDAALWEFMTDKALLKMTEIYYFFEKKLREIDPRFTELELIDEQASKKMVEEAISLFGAKRTFIFAVLNSVVFPKTVYTDLQKKSLFEKEEIKKAKIEKAEAESLLEKMQKMDREMQRMKETYEKKLLGLEKKYEQDVALLKKEVSRLKSTSSTSV